VKRSNLIGTLGSRQTLFRSQVCEQKSPGMPGLFCFFTSQSIASTSDFGDVLLPSLAMLKAQFGQKCPIRHPHLNSKLKAKNLL
jgi:hypothetical protein